MDKLSKEAKQELLAWASKRSLAEINSRIDELLTTIVQGRASGEELERTKLVASKLAKILKKRKP